MTQSNPNQIQHKIDRTREDLSSNVNALADKVSPNRIVGPASGGPERRSPA